jgi:hypothetical protein
VTQFIVTLPAANLAWQADDVLQVLVTVFEDTTEADVRLAVGDTWLPVEMAGGSVRRETP